MRRTIYLFMLFFGCSHLLPAQEKFPGKYRKLSPLLSNRSPGNQVATWWIVTNDTYHFKNYLAAKKLDSLIIGEYAATGLFIVRTNWAVIDTSFLSSRFVVFADRPRIPKEELVINGFDNTTNQLNTVHSEYPGINGNNLIVSVKENKPDTNDIDFKGRYRSTPLNAATVTAHATIMSTIISGGGNSHYTAKGSAWGSLLSSSSFASLLPDANTAYQQYGISVQNHSYGTGIENYYGADAAAYDASTIARPSLLHVFSAGNAGEQTSTVGNYAGIERFANLTGSFKMAKNILTVGAVDSLYQVEARSSKGPAYDGRIKPELVAFGEDGSSGAAAIVSGIALLLQQVYGEQHSGQLPPTALVKAILINTADDTGAPGPDFQSGYGNANGYKAVKAMQAAQYFTGTIVQDQLQPFIIQVPPGIRQLHITLSWNDPAAPANAPTALVNDLDMELFDPTHTQSWKPWVLNHFPHRDSLLQLPKRKTDRLNNTEQITLDHPAPGDYTIDLHGYIITGTQNFAVAWQLDTADRFKWYYPAKEDNLTAGENNILRWGSGFGSAPGKLEYSVNGGLNWQLISDNLALQQGYYRWTAPNTFTTALLRMTINSQSFVSDTFTIASRLLPKTGFNCPDSFLLYWNRPPAVNNFRLYRLGEKYLEPVIDLNDTSIVLRKVTHPGQHYAVAPLLPPGKTGVKSFTFDYTTQGIGCYIRTFLADPDQEAAVITVELGTLHGVKQIVLEKLSGTGYILLKRIDPSGLHYTITDTALQQGINTYRLKIELISGTNVYSQPETIYYFRNNRYLVFPNPARAAGALQVLSAEPQPATLLLFNTMGQQVLQRPLNNLTETIPLQGLQKGTYFLIILRDGKKDHKTAIVIQ